MLATTSARALAAVAVTRITAASVSRSSSPAVCRGTSLPDCMWTTALLASVELPATAAPHHCNRPRRVLFVGNSLAVWNDSTETHVKALGSLYAALAGTARGP